MIGCILTQEGDSELGPFSPKQIERAERLTVSDDPICPNAMNYVDCEMQDIAYDPKHMKGIRTYILMVSINVQ